MCSKSQAWETWPVFHDFNVVFCGVVIRGPSISVQTPLTPSRTGTLIRDVSGPRHGLQRKIYFLSYELKSLIKNSSRWLLGRLSTERKSLLHYPSDFFQGAKVVLLSILILIWGKDRNELSREHVIIFVIVSLVSVKLLPWIDFSWIWFPVLASGSHFTNILRESKPCTGVAVHAYLESIDSLALFCAFYTHDVHSDK